MMKLILTFLCNIFLIISLTASVQTDPVVQGKQVESFAKAMTDYNKTLKRGEMVSCKNQLSSLISMAEAEFDQYDLRKMWLQRRGCENAQIQNISYKVEGRYTKQNEILEGLKQINTKSNLEINDLKIASNYLNFFYESMQESLEEVSTVHKMCP